jgi:hypothetical protein
MEKFYSKNMRFSKIEVVMRSVHSYVISAEIYVTKVASHKEHL